MSAELKLKALAGGSLSLQVDDTLATDETFNVSVGGVESGNGYIKFPDGTLICYGRMTSGTAVDGADFNGLAGTTSGDLGRFTNSATFASPFTTNTYSLTTTSENIYSVSVIINSKSVSGFQCTEWIGTTRSAGTISWQAIGRWK